MKLRQITLALAIAAMASAAHASSVVRIDPDGPGGPASVINVLTLDWAPGNSLATPVGNLERAADVQVGDILQTYAHARLSSFKDADNKNISTPGLDKQYEWTFVAAFQEQASLVDVGFPGFPILVPQFTVIPGGINFFEIWVSAPDSYDLTGRNFANGKRVLAGNILPFDPLTGVGAATFSPSSFLPGVPLDQNGANNYPNVKSISGTGGGKFAVKVTDFDTDYFLTPPTILFANFDTQINLPFTQANPSSCFWDGTNYINGVGPITPTHPDQCPTNTVGPHNGLPSILGGSGPNNVLFQNSSMSFVAVPEPATLALVGLGLVGLGFSLRRRSA